MGDNSPIEFLDYDKITDILIFFDQYITFRFNVSLAKRDQDGRRRFFHREVAYESRYSNVGEVVGIKRDMNFYYTIDDSRNYLNGVMIGIQDVFFLKMLIEKNILPWFIGTKSIYGTSPDDGKIIIKGKWTVQQFTLSDYKYINFMPIVIEYEDGKTNYGIRMILNNPNNFVDIDLNKFIAFYTIIANTDMYTLASTMMTYAKNEPYGVNMYNMLTKEETGTKTSSQKSNIRRYGESTNNFFSNLNVKEDK